MEEQKKRVSVEITKHIREFIDPNNGQKITREQALGLKPKITSKPRVAGDEN